MWLRDGGGEAEGHRSGRGRTTSVVPALTRQHGTAAQDVAVTAQDSHGHAFADEAVRGRGAEACHCGRDHVTAVEDVTFMQEDAQTAASDVATSLQTRWSEGGRRGPLLRTKLWDDRRGPRPSRRGCGGQP